MVSQTIELGSDGYAVCGTRFVKPDSTLLASGVGNVMTVYLLRRLRSGMSSNNFDIPGQWPCKVCHATRCWPAKKRCYRCDAPSETVPNNPPPPSPSWVLWGWAPP